MPNFLALFQEVHFWSIKRIYFSKMPMYWAFNCFLGCWYISLPSPHFCKPFFLWVKWLLNLEFWRPQKKDQVAWIEVRGGGLGDSGNAQKKMVFFCWCLPLRRAAIFKGNFPKYDGGSEAPKPPKMFFCPKNPTFQWSDKFILYVLRGGPPVQENFQKKNFFGLLL